jgi:hypothetical protein
MLLFPPFLRGVRGDKQIFDTSQISSKRRRLLELVQNIRFFRLSQNISE